MAARRKAASKKTTARKAPAKKAAKRAPKAAKAPPEEPKSPPMARRTGRPSLLVSEEMRSRVRLLRGFGLGVKDVAKCIDNPKTGRPISHTTLEKYFKQELADGEVRANAKVVANLYKRATGDGVQSVTAAIWWTKARMGWRGEERIHHEVSGNSGVLVAPASVSPDQWLALQKEKNGKKTPPGGDDSNRADT